eukprot:TRINITY_DN22585_c0_g1_i2.p1 TRINITY_DN22585_c0_g1~~TRINITY_DN22585_c0_g1_i2.p1  ORF type:complete len:366 (-),score=68.70 TRINITY_DN22585_c0_g1_i2:10-1107(-)
MCIRDRSGHRLVCSFYEPANTPSPRPCVMYLHGNGGCRIDAYYVMMSLLPLGISVCAFDFSGCGQSEGDYITLGWKERFDAEAVANFLVSTGRVSHLGVWGRSMGAATTLLFAERFPYLSVLIADSPFSSIEVVATEFASRKSLLLKFLASSIISVLRTAITERIGADIFEPRPVDAAPKIRTPAFFGVGRDDTLTKPEQVQLLFQQFSGAPKGMVSFEGDHYSERTAEFFNPAIDFLLQNIYLRPLLSKVEYPIELSPMNTTPRRMEDVRDRNGGRMLGDALTPPVNQRRQDVPSRSRSRSKSPITPNVGLAKTATSFNERKTSEKVLTPNSTTVRKTSDAFNCLLYTSPSPRDRQKSRMPSSA